MKRSGDRSYDQLRSPKVTFSFIAYHPGSVLFEMGNTKVLCTATLQNTVPPYIRGKDHGWLNAEYALMPTSTHTRTPREAVTLKRSGRSVEISRLISRTLRTVVDLKAIQERTIAIDCDVLQADAGTRTAAITGSYIALFKAQEAWLAQGLIEKPFLVSQIAAVSVSVNGEHILLDPDYQEDSSCDADFNFIFSDPETLVEVQGGAEKQAVAWHHFMKAADVAKKGARDLFSFYKKNNVSILDMSLKQMDTKPSNQRSAKDQKAPLFSLLNRQIHVSSSK